MQPALNILDYLHSETASFKERPFCLLDAFVLGIASYVMFENTPEVHASILGDTLLATSNNNYATSAAEGLRDTTSSSGNRTPSNYAGGTTGMFPCPVRVSVALESIPEDQLSNLSWFLAEAPAFKEALIHSQRFADLEISDVTTDLDREAYAQFAAMCFHVPDGSKYLSFRGTDSTLTGWEEDFALSVLNPVPSQYYALTYTCAMIEKWGSLPNAPAFYLGGHSKGGNLAVYAALHCPEELQGCLTGVYNFDGPGINPWYYGTQPVESISQRTIKVIPANSVVGRIFQDVTKPLIVDSSETGLMQHMPFSWKVTRADATANAAGITKLSKDIVVGAGAVVSAVDANGYTFVFDEANTALSNSLSEGFSAWLAGLDFNDRVEFCAILFGIVEYVSEDNNIETLPASLLKKLPDVIRHLASLDKETRHFAWQTISGLLGNLAHALF